MSDNIENIDVDSDEYLDAPKALRDHVKKLQSKLTNVVQERDTLKGTVTASALTDVLKEFKNPDRVKQSLLADKVDPLDSEAVKTWLASNGDDYAKGGGAPAEPQKQVASADQAAHAAFQAGADLASPADMTKHEATFGEITPDMTGADIIALYKKNGL